MNIRTFIPLAIALLVFLGSVAFYGLGYYLLNTLTEKATALNTKVEAKSRDAERATKAHIALSSLESDETSLNQYLFTKSDVVPFLEDLQGEGKPFNTKVDVLSVSDQKDAAHQRVVLSLSITGTFDGVMRTLGAIEYGPHDGIMTNVSLNASAGTASSSASSWTGIASYSVGLQPAASSTKP